MDDNSVRAAAELRKLNAEIAKLEAETAKIIREGRLYPLVIFSGIIAAGAAAVGLGFRLFSGN